MKKSLLFLLFCLIFISHIGGQTTPPPGCKFITMKVLPDKKFKFGLIAREGHSDAWIELGNEVFTPLAIGDSQTVPTAFEFSSPSGTVKVYGSFHIFGCPANGEIITELDATGFTPLEQLYCHNNSITKLGLKGCSNLTMLSCSENPLDTLDVTDCEALNDLACFGNGLKGIDLSHNQHLVKLQCPQNAISQLDLTANEELQEVNAGSNQLTAITFPKQNAIHLLYAYENKLKKLDLSNLTALDDLDIYSNLLESLDLSSCSKLESVDCSENKIKSLDVTASRDSIVSLSCSDNELSELEIGNCKLLNYVNASNNKLTELQMEKMENLEKLYVYSNQIDFLDASECKLLSTLSISDNTMTACSLNDLYKSLPSPAFQGTLEISGNPGATTSTTSIATAKNWKVDVAGDGTGCPTDTIDAPPAGTPVIKLTTKPGSSITVTMRVYAPNQYVWIEAEPGTYRKELISSDYDNPSQFTISCPGDTVKLYSNVADFSCSKNGEAITAIDASNNPDLGTLYCHENAITTLNVSGCPYLIDLSCGKNKIKSLDLTGINYIQYLFCYDNELNELDLSHCKSIEELECSSNHISTLDLSNLRRATTIMCHTNKIEQLNLANCKQLQEFSCANNQLKKINVDSCENLTGFSCGSNQLTSLDVSKCLKLNRLFCSVNPNLKEITLASNSSLQQFSAMECGLEEMNIPASPSLTKVALSHNPLIDIEIGGAGRLNNMAIDQCQLSVCAMNQFLKDLPETTAGTLKIAGNPDVETALTTTATSKGWSVDVEGDGTGCATGINAVNEETLVLTYHQTIEVTTPLAAKVTVCDMTGKILASQNTTPHTPAHIHVPAGQAYIVAIDGKAQKVVVK